MGLASHVSRAIAAVLLLGGVLDAASAQPVRLQARIDQAPPQNLTVTRVEGQSVTLSWSAAAVRPDQYVVEGGVTPGEVLARFVVPGSATTTTFTVPRGIYFARVHAVYEETRTDPSNEVEIVVGELRPPSAPADVAALAVGSDVVVYWRETYQGGAPSATVVQVSGDLQLSIPAPVTGPLEFLGVPSGRYIVQLRARNAAGDSDLSPAVLVSVAGAQVQSAASSLQAPDAPRLPVRYETFTTPRLSEFVSRERLLDVVAGADTEFNAILRLREWVAGQFPKGNPDPYPPWDATTVLDWIRSGVTGGFCAQYAQIFVQALAAFGVPARYVELGPIDNPYGHFTAEVWSNDFNKWVYLDPDFNMHFERDGVPQSVLEVHDAYVSGTDHELDLVLGTVRADSDPRIYPHRLAAFFYYHRYHLKANHVTVPDESASFDRFSDSVEWHDALTVPWEISTVPSLFLHERLTQWVTSDRTLIEWRPNQVWITARRTGPMQLTLDLQHNVLQWQAFEYRVIDDQGSASAWTRSGSSRLIWQVDARDRRLEVRGVNVRGRTGPAATIALVP